MANHPSLKDLTDYARTENWSSICDKFDITVRPESIPAYKQKIAEFMLTNYLPKRHQKKTDLTESLIDASNRLGLPIKELIESAIPSLEPLKKGDLAEAVGCLTFEELLGLVVPYYKWANKDHKNVSAPGIDIMAFKFAEKAEDDVLFATEAKWRENTNELKKIIRVTKNGVVTKLANLDTLQLCSEITMLVKKLEDKKQVSEETVDRVENFLNRIDKHSDAVYNVTFFMVDSGVDVDQCISLLAPVRITPRRLFSINHKVPQLYSVTMEIYEGIENWPALKKE